MRARFRDSHPYLAVVLEGRRRPLSTWAMIDTGFSGSLMLPSTLRRSVAARGPVMSRTFTVADGRRIVHDLFEVYVLSPGRRRAVLVSFSGISVPLVGALFLRPYVLTVDYRRGRAVLRRA